MKKVIAASLSALVSVTIALAQDPGDPGWPRQVTKQGSTIVFYQPQVDEWKDFKELSWRMAISLTPAGGKQVVGVVEAQAHTDVDNDNKIVHATNIKVTATHFPSLAPGPAAQMDQLTRAFLPASTSVSLHRLVASAKKSESVSAVPLRNDPPEIFVSYSPAILLAVDGEPVLSGIPKTGLEFVVNTTWPLFFEKSKPSYFLLVGQEWMTAASLDGPWAPTGTLPKDLYTVAADPEWASLKKVIPPRAAPGAVIPKVFHSKVPAEVILFEGKPAYAQIPGTHLAYSTNTSSYLFLDTATKAYYYLTGGRWFRAGTLEGPWSFATTDLPPDFARIPPHDPASIVLAWVPGTEEAKDAVLLAQVPTEMTVEPGAASTVRVVYGGDPSFEPITGTTLYYATNTQDKVIRVGDVYYLCLQGVWFMSAAPQGPWVVAGSVPQVIYTIPPSSPVYNVTYVTQVTVSGTVQSSYTAGYMGAFVVGVGVGVIVANGSGYYYPPYIYHPPYGYPVYYAHPVTYGCYGSYGTAAHYNAATGAYGVSQTVSGPYGSATRAASYNPYTGTAARGASVSTPYGSRSAAQAYNPYTGNYAATKQGSSPTAQWGSSVVSNGNKSAYTQHYSTSKGTVASAQTSTGGKAAGANTAFGSSTAGKTSSGDMYATHDGNVYKNTGSGWESANNSGYNSAAKSSSASAQQSYKEPSGNSQAAAQGRSQAPSSEMQQEASNRQRGEQSSQRFQQSGGGGGFSRGGGGGGGRRR